ncbi:hypothetical protein [Sphingomonas faeni]|uniref:hypothetical protein n=1 Tax=Sphingomonas faeni TaxID=185950 RepID=UPI0020BF9719|nr:hypothetical protein [Sphingomonas faeni]MCK8455145.1 hypothetical protein [Sphingomonas faeni]
MTTYPLSEPATIYSVDASGEVTSDVLGRGTLEDCADIVAGLSADRRKAISIRMDSLDLQFGSEEVVELLRFLHEEGPGLSNGEITEIKSA